MCNCFPVHRETKVVGLAGDESSVKEALEKFFDSLVKSKKVCKHFSTVIGYVKCTYTHLIHHIILVKKLQQSTCSNVHSEDEDSPKVPPNDRTGNLPPSSKEE